MKLQVIEQSGQRLLTTKQIAEAYGTDVKTVQYNFRYNKRKYREGKHYIELTGDALKELKTRSEFQSSLKYVKRIYLWTEKGALLHAKSINTDKAWEVYDWLVDFYFRVKEESSLPEEEVRLDVASNRAVQDKLKELDEYCITIRCLIKEYGARLTPSHISGKCYTLRYIGAMLNCEIGDLEKLSLSSDRKD